MSKNKSIDRKLTIKRKKVIISTYDVDKSSMTGDNLPNESTIDITDADGSRLSTIGSAALRQDAH